MNSILKICRVGPPPGLFTRWHLYRVSRHADAASRSVLPRERFRSLTQSGHSKYPGAPVQDKTAGPVHAKCLRSKRVDSSEDLQWAQSSPPQWTPRRRNTLAKSANSSAAIASLKPYTLS